MITQQLNQMERHYIRLHLDRFCCTKALISTSLRTGESNDTVMLSCYECYNICSYGASIVAETQKVPKIFQRLLNNPLCFLLYEDKGVVPNEWNEVSDKYIVVNLITKKKYFLVKLLSAYVILPGFPRIKLYFCHQN